MKLTPLPGASPTQSANDGTTQIASALDAACRDLSLSAHARELLA